MDNLQSSAQKELQRIIDQVERLSEEQKALGGDIRDKLLEAKSKGFDVKIIRKILRRRKLNDAERQQEDALTATYEGALGMAGLPLADYADKVHEIGKAHGIPKSVRDAVIAEAAE